MRKVEELEYFEELWHIENKLYTHKLPEYIEENGKKDIWYKQVEPVYVCQKNKWWNGEETVDICPVDFSKEKNKNLSWRWKREIRNEDIGKNVFLTKEEAEAKYSEIPQAERDRIEEIKQLIRIIN